MTRRPLLVSLSLALLTVSACEGDKPPEATAKVDPPTAIKPTTEAPAEAGTPAQPEGTAQPAVGADAAPEPGADAAPEPGAEAPADAAEAAADAEDPEATVAAGSQPTAAAAAAASKKGAPATKSGSSSGTKVGARQGPGKPKITVKSISGPDADTKGLIKGQMRSMTHCYENALEARPTLTGTVTLNFNVGPNGVTNGKAKGPAGVGECMIQTAARWRISFQSSGAVEVKLGLST